MFGIFVMKRVGLAFIFISLGPMAGDDRLKFKITINFCVNNNFQLHFNCLVY